MKAMRNTLFTSWSASGSSGTKAFLNAEGVMIGKSVIEYCYKRDQDRISRGKSPLTRVNEATVSPDKWSKMSVTAALRVFESQTLAEIAGSIYEDLEVITQDCLGQDQFKDDRGQVIGFFPEVAEHFKVLLRQKHWLKTPCLESAIASFEWLAHVHEIFNSTLMNTKLVITKRNIKRYEDRVKKSLEYFERLRTKSLERRENKDATWDATFLAPQTWLNLRLTCRGFFHYCQCIIDYADSNEESILQFYGVSVAHSNTSVLEAWFSLVRQMKLDSATSYATAVSTQQMKNASALATNGMYSEEQAGKFAKEDAKIGPDQVIQFHEKREKRTNEIAKEFFDHQHDQYTQPIPVFNDPNTLHIWRQGLTDFENDILSTLLKTRLQKGFIYEILNDDSCYFHDWIRLSLNRDDNDDKLESKWYCRLLNWARYPCGRGEIDKCFRKIMTKILDLMIFAMKNRKNNRHSFEFKCYQFLGSMEFDGMIESTLPKWIYENQPNCFILGMCLKELAQRLLLDATIVCKRKRFPEHYKEESSNALTNDEKKSEVNRHFGWAIFSSMKRLRSQDALNLLESMRIRLDQVDDYYYEHCYDTSVSLLNSGGYTLVARWIFAFGLTVLSALRQEFTMAKMNRDPKNSFATAKKKIMENNDLKISFIKVCKSKDCITDEKRMNAAIEKVYTTLLTKVLHCRFAPIIRRWVEINVKSNDKQPFRAGLKAATSTAAKKMKNKGPTRSVMLVIS